MNFSTRVQGIFADMNTDYASMNNLMQDVALGREIYDDETGRSISKAEANAKILEFSRKVFGITDIKDKKQVRRAIRDNGREWMDIVEDTIDAVINYGFEENMWFNDLVDQKTIAYGDRQDFYVENDALLLVAKAGTSHHDHIIQRLPKGSVVSVPTDLYVVRVGADINKYVVGQVDWVKLIDTIARSFMAQIQTQIFAEVSTAASSLPVTSGFVGTGALSSSTKADFDEIIENVSAANNGAEVVVMGTKSALSKISALADVDYSGSMIAAAQKDNVMNTGNIGIYEGTKLVTIPNRFADSTLTTKIFSSDILLILPVIGDDGKFVKFVDEGDTNILEVTERGSYESDIMTYEVQRHFGVGTVIGRQFGQWTLA